MRRFLGITLALGLVGGLAALPALAKSSPSSSGHKKVVLTIGLTNEIDSLNPFEAVEGPSYENFWLNYDILLNFSQKDLSPAPNLATDWSHSKDGLTWTFHIRHDVKWSDGKPLTSADIVYTFNRDIKEKASCCVGYLTNVTSVSAPDPYTVVIKTSKPSNQMESIWVDILPEHIWKNVGAGKDEKDFTNLPIVGSGPFQTVEWQKGQFWRLERNPYYWGPKPAVDEIIFRLFNNQDAMVQALKQGEIDAAEQIQQNLFNSLKGEKDITSIDSYGFSFVSMGMNTGAPQGDGNAALQDVRVRQAIAHAIDKKTLINKIQFGAGAIGSTIIPPALKDFHAEPSASQVLDFNISESKRLLAQAGYKDTNGNGIVDKGGKDLVLRFFTRSERSDSSKEAQFVTAWLKQAGIGTKVQAMSDNTLTNVITAGKYDLFIWGWGTDPTPDFLLSVVTCGERPPSGIWSDTYYCNKTYDQEYLQQKTILDRQQWGDLVKKMQMQVYQDAPYVVFYYDTDPQAYRNDHFTGFVNQPAPNGPIFFSYGPYSYLNVRPVSSTSGTGASQSTGLSPLVWVLVAAVVIVVIVGAVMLRRRVGAEDRE